MTTEWLTKDIADQAFILAISFYSIQSDALHHGFDNAVEMDVVKSFRYIEDFLKAGADPNANEGKPLICAAENGLADVAEILMDLGAEPTLQASAIAKAHGHMNVADLIKSRYEQDRLNRQLVQANQSEELSQTPQTSRRQRL